MEADEVRENAVKLLCRIFTTKDGIDGSFRSLCVALLNRLNDPSPAIRVTMLQSARALYTKLSEYRGALDGTLRC